MASWRDTTPADALADLDTLVAAALRTAQALLAARAGFAPYGLVIDDTGSLAPLKPADDATASAESIVESLHAIAAGRDDVRAVAFVADITYDGSDAVRASLEHRDGGPAVSVIAPYTQTEDTGEVTYRELDIAEAARRIWA